MHLTADSCDAMDSWYKGYVSRLKLSTDERAGHFASCAQAHMLKLAAIINILEGRGAQTLEVESVETGCKLVEALVVPMFHTYASLVPTAYAKLRAKILRAVQSSSAGGIGHAALARAIVSSAGVPPDTVERVKVQMLNDGTLKLGKNGKVYMGG
jgi:hypothetical protein